MLEIFGRTCGITMTNPSFICVDNAADVSSSPFGSTYMLFTVGMLVLHMILLSHIQIVVACTLPFLFLNLAENVTLQLGTLTIQICL